MLQIDVRIDGDGAVLTLSGRLIGSESPKLLREKADALLREGYRKFVLDLASISYADSSGLGEIVQIYVTVRRDDGSLRIPALDKHVDLSAIHEFRDTFEIGSHGPVPDPLNPRLPDIRWEFTVGVATTILMTIGVMLLQDERALATTVTPAAQATDGRRKSSPEKRSLLQ
jgi:anti-anti-sigma factor